MFGPEEAEVAAAKCCAKIIREKFQILILKDSCHTQGASAELDYYHPPRSQLAPLGQSTPFLVQLSPLDKSYQNVLNFFDGRIRINGLKFIFKHFDFVFLRFFSFPNFLYMLFFLESCKDWKKLWHKYITSDGRG